MTFSLPLLDGPMKVFDPEKGIAAFGHRDGRVTKPTADHFHRGPVVLQETAAAGPPQVMEGEVFEPGLARSLLQSFPDGRRFLRVGLPVGTWGKPPGPRFSACLR